MDKKKRKKLEAAGWKISSVEEFLGLTPEEMHYIELKLALCWSLKKEREKQGLTQKALANLLGSSQSRVAKMEAGDKTVSVDLLIKGLLALGLSTKELSKILARADKISPSA